MLKFVIPVMLLLAYGIYYNLTLPIEDAVSSAAPLAANPQLHEGMAQVLQHQRIENPNGHSAGPADADHPEDSPYLATPTEILEGFNAETARSQHETMQIHHRGVQQQYAEELASLEHELPRDRALLNELDSQGQTERAQELRAVIQEKLQRLQALQNNPPEDMTHEQ